MSVSGRASTGSELEQVHQLALQERAESPLYLQLVLQTHPPMPQTDTISVHLHLFALPDMLLKKLFSHLYTNPWVLHTVHSTSSPHRRGFYNEAYTFASAWRNEDESLVFKPVGNVGFYTAPSTEAEVKSDHIRKWHRSNALHRFMRYVVREASLFCRAT